MMTRIFLSTLFAVSTVTTAASAFVFPDAHLVYPSAPVSSTVWTVGHLETVQWSLPSDYPTNVTVMSIRLGTGENSTVQPTDIFIHPALQYPSTNVSYVVPYYVQPGKYCLIFLGEDTAGNIYGPNWATWFTINADTSAPTSSSLIATTAAATTSS